jgi:hypothetical protein
MLSLSAPVKWGGIALIVLVGLLHAVEGPEYFEKAAYIGVLFALNVLGALVAAYGIWRGERWGWWLGSLVAGGALVLYVISRSVGMPGFHEREWAEPSGLVSLLLEALFIVWTLWAARESATGPRVGAAVRA